MTWINFHGTLLRQFLVNLGRTLILFSAVMAIFALPEADLGDDPWPLAGYLALDLLDSVLPLALLVATLFTVGPRAHFKELAALTAAGFSMFQIMWPLFGVAAAAMVYSAVVRWMGIPLGDPPAATPAAVQTAFHAGLAYPLTNVLGVAAGIILVSSPTRKSMYSGFLSALFIVVGFNVVTAAGQMLGRHKGLPPVVAGWLGPVVAAVVLLVMWRRARL